MSENRKKMMPFFIGLSVIAVVVLILVIAYKAKNAGAPGGAPGGMGGRRGGARGASTVSVKTMKTEITTLHGYISTNGEVESQNSVSVFPDMGGKVMYDLDLKGPIGLVVGSEGEGAGRLVKEKCDFTAAIPMKGAIDSLNASVAAGVLMYEIVRQRTNNR